MDDHRGVRVPPELHAVPPRPVEEYVRARLIQFAGPFARRINPTLPLQLIQQTAVETISALPPPEYSGASVEHRDLQLVFRHDCLSLGCLDPQCVLCEHNPHRRCNVNFAAKYLVNDVLKAKCEAPIRVEIIDRSTGVPVGEDIPDVHLEMAVLDGNAYDAKCLEAGQERDEDLESCSLLLNNKATALLQPGASASHSLQHKVVVQLQRGMAQLPDLHVTDSSEAMLSGRKPPFRLLVKCVHSDGRRLNIRHAVSEGFVVATRRTRTAGKVEIPNVDDHVSKLEHMGKETVKKLQDIHGSALQCGIELSVHTNCINKVGEFRKLAMLADADGHLRQKLQQVLKLSKEKFDDARDHAMRAVVADNRMRIWYVDKSNMEVGLLFTCRLGNADLERPVGLLQKKAQDGTQTTMEATLMAQQTPGQREQVRQLQPQAVASWWQPGHPGWAIYPVDSDQFMSTGALDSLNILNEQPSHPSSPNSMSAMEQSQAYFNGGMPGLPPGAGVAPFGAGAAYVPGMPPELASLVAAGRIEPLARSSMVHGNSRGLDDGSEPDARGGPRSSPFSGQLSNRVGMGIGPPDFSSMPGLHMPSMFQSMPMSSADLNKFAGGLGSLAGLSALSSFPSVPHTLPSADLDQLLQQHHDGGVMLHSPSGVLGDAHYRLPSMGRLSSMGMGKLESMELPDATAAIAMLHDMPPEHQQHRSGSILGSSLRGGGAHPVRGPDGSGSSPTADGDAGHEGLDVSRQQAGNGNQVNVSSSMGGEAHDSLTAVPDASEQGNGSVDGRGLKRNASTDPEQAIINEVAVEWQKSKQQRVG